MIMVLELVTVVALAALVEHLLIHLPDMTMEDN
jgi:hypothetical protein